MHSTPTRSAPSIAGDRPPPRRVAALRLLPLALLWLGGCGEPPLAGDEVTEHERGLTFVHDPYRLTGDHVAVGGPATKLLVARISANGTVQARFRTTAWGNWRELGGALNSGLTISEYGGNYTIYGRGTDGNLQANAFTGATSTWGGWQSLGAPSGGITSAPFAVVWPSTGYISVFVRGGNAGVWLKDYQPGSGQ